MAAQMDLRSLNEHALSPGRILLGSHESILLTENKLTLRRTTMANLTPEWLKKALEVTGGFETDGNPWAGVSNDFDQMGISCGILQWNIGSGSLQPLVKGCGQTAVQKYMPVHGDELWTACQSAIPQGLTIVRAWQPNNKLKPDVLKELKALFGTPEMSEHIIATAPEDV